MLATDYAEYYEIEAQREGEDDYAFRNRVANALRARGRLIEAHEAFRNERYEQSDDVMGGVIGAVAQAMQGTSYRGDPIGNDIAAGVVAQDDKPKLTPEMAMLMVELFGGSR